MKSPWSHIFDWSSGLGGDRSGHSYTAVTQSPVLILVRQLDYRQNIRIKIFNGKCFIPITKPLMANVPYLYCLAESIRTNIRATLLEIEF